MSIILSMYLNIMFVHYTYINVNVNMSIYEYEHESTQKLEEFYTV